MKSRGGKKLGIEIWEGLDIVKIWEFEEFFDTDDDLGVGIWIFVA